MHIFTLPDTLQDGLERKPHFYSPFFLCVRNVPGRLISSVSFSVSCLIDSNSTLRRRLKLTATTTNDTSTVDTPTFPPVSSLSHHLHPLITLLLNSLALTNSATIRLTYKSYFRCRQYVSRTCRIRIGERADHIHGTPMLRGFFFVPYFDLCVSEICNHPSPWPEPPSALDKYHRRALPFSLSWGLIGSHTSSKFSVFPIRSESNVPLNGEALVFLAGRMGSFLLAFCLIITISASPQVACTFRRPRDSHCRPHFKPAWRSLSADGLGLAVEKN